MPRLEHPDPPLADVPAPVDDARELAELSAEENADLCAGCVKCCTYITVQIDSPRAAWEYDQWIWALYHKGVSLYLERPEKWFLHFETRCENLNQAGRCSIHGRHPVLCRDYDPRSCERRLPLADVVAWFDTGDQLEDWLRARRPAHWRRLLAYRRQTPPGPPAANGHATQGALGALVSIEEPKSAERPPVLACMDGGPTRSPFTPRRRSRA